MMKFDKEKLFIFWGTPLMLLVLLILSYGLMIPWLGYGFDEWHFIYHSTQGPDFLKIFHYDGHPQAFWSYALSFNLLGYNPLYWHVYSLLWRWFAVFSFWLCLRQLWPNDHRRIFFVGALFAIHPIYTLQVFPITFFEIWLGYTLLFLSFLFTVRAVQNPGKRLPFTIIAIILTVVHVFTREYTWFVELMRPIFIGLALPSKDVLRKRILHTVKIWFPYFIIFLSTVIWRGFFYTPLRKYFQVQEGLLSNPGKTLLVWFTDIFPDISTVTITSWYETFNSEYYYLIRPFNVVLLILTILLIIVGKIYLQKVDAPSQNDRQWTLQAMILGLPSILFGILPFYIAGYSLHLTESPYNARFVIGMLPGSALITVALLETIITKQNLRIWMTVILLSLSASWHIRYTNDFRKVWAYQSDFLQQLTWRVPGMEENTAIFVWEPSLPDLDRPNADFTLHADFALSMAVNSMYDSHPANEGRLSYWYHQLSDETMDIALDSPFHAEHAITYFDGNTSDSLFFYYDPENNRCLHLVSTEDQYYRQYPDVIKDVSPYTTSDRISLTAKQDIALRNDIFKSSEDTWCFYYQKAELARQFQQWDVIPLLWEEVSNNDLQTEFGPEYIPFIDGFAHLAEWQKARDITLTADRTSKAMGSILCPLWDDIELSTLPLEERDATIKQVREKLACTDG